MGGLKKYYGLVIGECEGQGSDTLRNVYYQHTSLFVSVLSYFNNDTLNISTFVFLCMQVSNKSFT